MKSYDEVVLTRVREHFDTLDPNKYQVVHHLRRQVARYRWQRAITRIIIQVKLGKSFRQTKGPRTSQIIIPKWSSDSCLDKRAKDKQGVVHSSI